MTRAQIVREIERCDREIEEMLDQPPVAPAWLTTLGIEDWQWEKRILESMLVEESDESYEASEASAEREILSAMTVRELCELLEVKENGDLPVSVQCSWHGEAPADNQFEIKSVVITLERDTAEDICVIECRQDG